MNNIEKESPFAPGKPVPIEYFVGRINEINRLQRAIHQTSGGRNENIFITGERGIGKSSLASFARFLAIKNYDFLGVHCSLGGIRDLEGMIRIVFQRLFQEASEKSIRVRLKELLGKFIKGVDLFGISVEFTSDHAQLRTLVENFLPVLRKIYYNIREQKRGILIILDDLNGITVQSDFAHFLKSFVDEIAVSQEPIPILLILVGIEDRREDLIKFQPSITRIFDIIELTSMTEEEAAEFFTKAFARQGIKIKPEAMDLMVRFSGGLPMLMHEVGDGVFWRDNDSFISEEDAQNGILDAADNVGRKYLDPQVYNAMRSVTYRSILRKLAKIQLGMSFIRKDIITQMSTQKANNFDNFLRRAQKVGIITKGESRGEYRFVNQLFHLYIFLEAFKAEREK